VCSIVSYFLFFYQRIFNLVDVRISEFKDYRGRSYESVDFMFPILRAHLMIASVIVRVIATKYNNLMAELRLMIFCGVAPESESECCEKLPRMLSIL